MSVDQNFSAKPVVIKEVGKIWSAETSRSSVALQNVNLAVEPGEFITLLGPSGCGKSTLLYLIAGLEPVTSGQILSFGERINKPSPDRSLIFQDTSLFPWLTVGKNVAFGLSIQGVDRVERLARSQEALHRVGLAAAVNKLPAELSGGMRQRVALARALTMRPKVLLMDEPFAALDVQTRARMQSFLVDVWRDSSATVIFVTHHIDEAVALSDRVAVFTARPGRIKTVVPIKLSRPRDLFSPAAEKLRYHFTELLKEEVEAAFADQEQL
jgi:NitT/TauT family transport system ATP-binding protein